MSILSRLSLLHLKTKIIATVLLLFLGSIWTLTFLISKHLEQDMTAQIEAQQFSTASYIANSIESQVKLRLDSLASIASLITPEIISDLDKLREFLRQKDVFKTLFRSGLMVISKEGKGIADYPEMPGRSAASYEEIEFFKDVTSTLKPAVGRPQIGRFSRTPLIAFGVPIFDRAGQLAGVLTATTSLTDPALLGAIETTLYQGFPDSLLLVSPRYRIIITGNDPARIMTPTLNIGVDSAVDKFMAGHEGSEISVTQRGIRMLFTAKQIPTPGWFVRVGLPTEIVFAPIKRMKIWAYTLAIGLSLLSSLLLWLVIRQALKPLYVASRLIQDITDQRLPFQKIPVTRDDDFGQLLTSFNKHLDYRRQAEEAHRKSEALYRDLVETSQDLIWQCDVEGRYTYLNPAWEQIFGYRVEEMVGKRFTDFQTPEYANRDLKEFARLLQGNTVKGLETQHIGRDGREIHLVFNAKILFDEQGNPAGTLGTAYDITNRKRIEDEKRGLEERLQRAEKMEALGQLAGGVAHDLNNVLGVLSGYSELLLENLPEGDRSRGHAEKILQSTVKGAAIIQDLLTLARRGVTSSEVINLNSVVSGFLKSPVFERMKDHHPRVTFRTECDPNLLNIKGSPVHLEKTVMNLVSNAAESISGKGEVTIRTESRYIDKAIKGYDEVQEGDYALLTVSDTGMGIPAGDVGKIFEPFYTKKAMGRSGTGLGLSIVWGTVKDHNGYIDLQTEVGRGTAFTLYFPVTREDPVARQQKEPIERYLGKGESVLVVDDIAEQRDVAASLLSRLGYEVHAVSSGEEAVEYLKVHQADILVLDMIMPPGIDGLDTYRRILDIRPKQKAILVSGFSETKRVNEARKLGAGAYVKKPYVMEKIGVAIRNELNRSQGA